MTAPTDRHRWAEAYIAAEGLLDAIGLRTVPEDRWYPWDRPIPLSRNERIALDTLRLLVQRGVVKPT